MSEPKIRIEQKRVTPAMAKKFLEKNPPKNRPIQWGRVQAFVKDIQAGAWKLTHQGICFDGEGQLIDGQHRLHAIVNADTAVDMVIAYNSEGEFEAPIDRGQPRSMALISGKSRRQLAAINVLRQLEQGFPDTMPSTLNDVNSYYERHAEWFAKFEQIPGYTRLFGGTVGAIIWAMPVDEQAATNWAREIITGEMLSKGDPALTFRRWLESGKQTRAGNWLQSMAAFNCLRHFVWDMKLTSIFTGQSGYRAFTAQRRKLKIANTPGVELVPSLAFKPSRGEVESE